MLKQYTPGVPHLRDPTLRIKVGKFVIVENLATVPLTQMSLNAIFISLKICTCNSGPRPLYMIISIYFIVRNVQAKVEPMLEAALQGLVFAVHVSNQELLNCHINWLLMTKKSIQMVKLETFDFKLKLKLVIEEVNPLGTSLDSATQICRD